jgi:uncharacterized membrane protein
MATSDPASHSTVEGRIVAALVLGAVSLVGLVFPPLLAAGGAGIYLSVSGLRRIRASNGAFRGRTAAWIALVLSVLGCLLSLVLPGFIIYVWIWSAFHGGRLPYE